MKLIPALERSPVLVALASRPMGKALVIAAASGLLFALSSSHWLETTVLLGLVAAVPARRAWILATGALFFLLEEPLAFQSLPYSEAGYFFNISGFLGSNYLIAGASLLVLVAGTWYARWARRGDADGFVSALALLAVFFAAQAGLAAWPGSGLGTYLSWILLFVFAKFACFFIRDLTAPKERDASVAARLAWFVPLGSRFFFPLWNQPERIDEPETRETAITRLKGLKLLAWALVIRTFQALLIELFYGSAGPIAFWEGMGLPRPLHYIPPIPHALRQIADGRIFDPGQAWTVLLLDFTVRMLDFAAFGHVIVAVLRLSGIYVLRNTYNLLQSRSILDFFGRFNYHFKELLLHSFFYPAFFRLSGTKPWIRVLLATFLATGFVHFSIVVMTRDPFLRGSLSAHLSRHFNYVIYCLVLSASVAGSMLRQLEGRAAPARGRAGWIATGGVFAFYAVLRLYDSPFSGDISLNHRFLLDLLGLR